MKRIGNILFDLDGTLIDSAEGVSACIRYALESLHLPCPPGNELTAYVGPPLRQALASICGPLNQALIEDAVALYRERFASMGLYEHRIYGGVREMLSALQLIPYNLFVATCKPQIYAEQVLAHCSLKQYFVAVHGSEFGGRLDDKSLLIAELIESHGLEPGETVMIGDRKHDVAAAKINGLWSIGITYGYGSREELIEADADYICDSTSSVVECLQERS